MEHTFLLKPGVWQAQGHFITPDGAVAQAEGRTVITHEPQAWRLQGLMRVLLDEPLEISNDYEVQPMEPGVLAARWLSRNPDLGTLQGNFAIAGDAIISIYRSADGAHEGSETLLLLADGSYLSRGALFSQGQLASTWAFILRRED